MVHHRSVQTSPYVYVPPVAAITMRTIQPGRSDVALWGATVDDAMQNAGISPYPAPTWDQAPNSAGTVTETADVGVRHGLAVRQLCTEINPSPPCTGFNGPERAFLAAWPDGILSGGAGTPPTLRSRAFKADDLP
jgi:hypothetical protein